MEGAVIKNYSRAPSVTDSLSSLISSFDAGDSHMSTVYDGRTTIFLFCHPVPFWWSQPSPRSGWNHIIWQYRFFSSPRCNKLHHIFHPMYRDNVHCLRCPFRFPRVWSQKTISRATVSDHYCLHAVPALSVKHVVGLERKNESIVFVLDLIQLRRGPSKCKVANSDDDWAQGPPCPQS